MTAIAQPGNSVSGAIAVVDISIAVMFCVTLVAPPSSVGGKPVSGGNVGNERGGVVSGASVSTAIVVATAVVVVAARLVVVPTPVDAGAVVAHRVAVADDDVVDIVGVDPGAGGQRVEGLGQQLLGMDVMQRAVGLALAAG